MLLSIVTFLPIPAAAEEIPVAALTGGGAIASGGGFRLNGAIDGFGLGQNAGNSAAPGDRAIGNGYYHAQFDQRQNDADPVWRQYVQAPRRPAQPSPMKLASYDAPERNSRAAQWLEKIYANLKERSG